MRLFGWFGKFYFPEIEIRWPKKKAFDHGNAFTLLFSLQSISGKCERERESAHARARGEDPVRDHELQLQSDGAIDGEIAIAISDRDRPVEITIVLSIAIAPWSQSRIAIAPLRRDRDLGSRSRRDRDLGSRRDWLHFWNWWFFFSRLWLVFSDLCFPSSFPNTRKYFPKNFLKCNQTYGNIFLFRKLAFPENMYFLENVLQQPNTT